MLELASYDDEADDFIGPPDGLDVVNKVTTAT